MALVEDLTPFFADFGVEGTLAGQAVRGIFDEPRGAELPGITAAVPKFTLPTAQVPAQPFDATLVVPAGTFKVREHLPDGTGLSALLLTRVS